MNAVTAWSYSRYETYALCPLKFKLRVIDKLQTAQSPAMARGNTVHLGAAAYLKGEASKPPAEFAVFAHPLKLINEIKQFDDIVIEQQWGFTREWKPTGWFGGDTWFRSILDVGVLYEDMTADAIDWKTGKKYGSNAEQMELNGMALLLRFAPATHATSRMVYLDIGSEDTVEVPRSDLEKLVAKWEKKIEPMFADEQFLPRPNDKCRFCDFARSNTGPHGGKCRFG